jgi:DNA-binding beta-propeller fold protein YncE
MALALDRRVMRVINLAAGALAALAVVSGAASSAAATPAVPNNLLPRALVTQFATATGQADRTFRIGRAPTDIVFAPDGKFVYVANSESHFISAIPATGHATAARAVYLDADPLQIAVSPDGRFLYVATVGGPITRGRPGSRVLVVTTSDLRIVGSIALVSAPQQLAMAPNGKTVWVVSTSSTGAEIVTPIRTATNRAGRAIRIASYKYEASAIAVTPDSRLVYVASLNVSGSSNPSFAGIVTPIRASTGAALKRITTGRWAFNMAVTPNGRTVYVSSYAGVTPIRTRSNTAGRLINAGFFPGPMVVTPNGKTLYVSNAAGQVVPISTASNQAGSPIQFSDADEPNGNRGTIAASPDSATVYVVTTTAGTSGIVIPIQTATSTLGSPITVGSDPIRIVISPNGKLGYVVDQND